MATQDTLKWVEIQPDTLDTATAKAYKAYKDSYAEMKKARDAFESAVSAALKPKAGKKIVFSHKFGKLSIAVTDDTERKSASKDAVSFDALVNALK